MTPIRVEERGDRVRLVAPGLEPHGPHHLVEIADGRRTRTTPARRASRLAAASRSSRLARGGIEPLVATIIRHRKSSCHVGRAARDPSRAGHARDLRPAGSAPRGGRTPELGRGRRDRRGRNAEPARGSGERAAPRRRSARPRGRIVGARAPRSRARGALRDHPCRATRCRARSRGQRQGRGVGGGAAHGERERGAGRTCRACRARNGRSGRATGSASGTECPVAGSIEHGVIAAARVRHLGRSRVSRVVPGPGVRRCTQSERAVRGCAQQLLGERGREPRRVLEQERAPALRPGPRPPCRG